MTSPIDRARHVVVITGAGFSAPSGLPVYRGSDAGWMPAELAEKSYGFTFADHLDELWPHWHDLAERAHSAQPNAAHHALARWERQLARGPAAGSLLVVTQNLDGLHQRAGSQQIIEAHGSILQARTIGEHTPLFDYVPSPGSSAPAAPDGSTQTRPDIVLFGEQPRGMAEAESAVEQADLVVFAGTSGRVWPVAGLLELAEAGGATTMLLNDEPWDHGRFDVELIGDVTQLDPLVPA